MTLCILHKNAVFLRLSVDFVPAGYIMIENVLTLAHCFTSRIANTVSVKIY